MGQIRFSTALPERLSQDVVERAYMAGMDGIPDESQNRKADDRLIIQRQVNESGNLYLPWVTDGFGELVLCTTSLMERELPYQLEVELARGTLNRLRNQQASWLTAGLTMTEQIDQLVESASQSFGLAATSQSDPTAAAKHAVETIRRSLTAIDVLSDEFTRQVLAIRHQQTAKLTTLLSCHVETEEVDDTTAQVLLPAFNSAVAPLNWGRIEPNAGQYEWEEMDRHVQWCRNNNLKVCGGPLLRLDRHLLPDWLYLWEEDFESLQNYLTQYIEAVVKRYSDSIHIWHCAGGTNLGGELSLTEEQRLRLTVTAIEAVQRVDSRIPIVVSFDQPCGEFLRNQAVDLSPIHFADALVRTDLGLSGIGLELNLGYWPGGTLPRDLLELNRTIDRWGLLGLPLLVYLTIPSQTGEDPLARQAAQPLGDGHSPQSQQALLQRLVPFLTAKQSVHGIIWNQLRDSISHPYAHGGLIDPQGNPKPALQALADFRQQHLL